MELQGSWLILGPIHLSRGRSEICDLLRIFKVSALLRTAWVLSDSQLAGGTLPLGCFVGVWVFGLLPWLRNWNVGGPAVFSPLYSGF